MNLTEALNALNAGKRIRRKTWNGNYWYQVKNTFLYLTNRWTRDLILTLEDINADDWEVKECNPHLTDKERRYLENLIHPFIKNHDILFRKHLTKDNKYILEITLIPVDDAQPDEYIELPYFSKESSMYAGLEEDYDYTNYDLKLFKE